LTKRLFEIFSFIAEYKTMSIPRNSYAIRRSNDAIRETTAEVTSGFYWFFKDAKDDAVACFQDVKTECRPDSSTKNAAWEYLALARSFIFIPYFPAFHSPGWLLRYIVGPYTPALLESFISDIGAGLTVGLLLLPQVNILYNQTICKSQYLRNFADIYPRPYLMQL
jgi:hypothetical protein